MKYLYERSILSLTILIACTLLLIFLTNRYILTIEFYDSNGNTFSGIPGQGSAVYSALQKWVYLSSTIYLLFKILVIGLILHTALYLTDNYVPFGRVIGIVAIAEYIFLIPAVIKIVTFNYTFQHGNLLDWHRYHIFSLLSLFSDVPADWYYPLQSLNLFEIAYWFLLAKGISRITAKDFDSSLKVVISSYVPALFFWVATVTFFTLMMFPATG